MVAVVVVSMMVAGNVLSVLLGTDERDIWHISHLI